MVCQIEGGKYLRSLEFRAWEWRKLHNEELYDLYSSQNIVRLVKSRKMRWAGLVAHMTEKTYEDRVSMGKPEGKRPL